MYARIIHATTTILIDRTKCDIEVIAQDRYYLKGKIETINISGKNMPTKEMESIIIPMQGTLIFYFEATQSVVSPKDTYSDLG